MKRPIISNDQLLKAAGKQRFEAGQLSFESSPVKAFHGNEKQASGTIDGFDSTIHYRGDGVEGACNCEDSDGFDFCHHCVHLTLHANKIAQQLISLSKGPDKSKVLAYLINLDKQVLAKQFLELIEDDSELFQRYLLRASLDNKEINYTSLKSRITELTRLKEKLFSQRQVKHFFARIENLLDELSLITQQGQEDKLLKLIIYAVQRLNKLLDKLDDRANQRQMIVDRINSLYQSLFPEITGRQENKIKQLFKLWLEDNHQLLEASVQILTEDDSSAKIFKDLAQAAWSNEGLESAKRARLSRYLLSSAIAENDLTLEQMYRITLASSADEWLLIAQRWQEAGETNRAIEVLEDQLNANPDSEAILLSLIELLSNKGNALPRLKQLFEQYPVASYKAMLFQAEQEAVLNQTREFAISILKTRNKSEEKNLLLELLIEQGNLTEASLLCATYTAELSLVISLARKIRTSHAKVSIELYHTALSRLLEKQLSKADQQAADLLKEVDQYLGRHEDAGNMLQMLKPALNRRPRVLQIFHSTM